MANNNDRNAWVPQRQLHTIYKARAALEHRPPHNPSAPPKYQQPVVWQGERQQTVFQQTASQPPKSRGTIVFVVAPTNRFLVLKTIEDGAWYTMGGKCEANETADNAGARKTRAATGFYPVKMVKLDHVAIGGRRDFHCYVAFADEEFEPVLNRSEFKDSGWFALGQWPTPANNFHTRIIREARNEILEACQLRGQRSRRMITLAAPAPAEASEPGITEPQ